MYVNIIEVIFVMNVSINSTKRKDLITPSPYFAHPYNDYDLETVEAAYRKTSDGRLKERLLMILLSLEGKQVDEIAEITHRCQDTVLKWLPRWNEKGFNGLKDSPYSGRPPILTELEVQKMLDWVCEESLQRWTLNL